MKIGVVFPQTDIGSDHFGIRDYAQAVEAMGYTHILAYINNGPLSSRRGAGCGA